MLLELKSVSRAVWGLSFLILGAVVWLYSAFVSVEELFISQPLPQEIVSSPLIVRGVARGPWFSEGLLSVALYDERGNELVSAQALADGEWMTEDFVPFGARLEFKVPDVDSGYITLEKANPSGLAQNASSYRLRVRFR